MSALCGGAVPAESLVTQELGAGRSLRRLALNVEAMRSAFLAGIYVRREALRIACVGPRSFHFSNSDR